MRRSRCTFIILALTVLLAAAPAAASGAHNGPLVYGWSEAIDRDDYSEIRRDVRVLMPGAWEPRVIYGCEVFTRRPDATPEDEVEACRRSEYGSPAVSLDGRLVAFDAGDQIGVVGIDGGDPRLLPIRRGVGGPRFSPDASRLVFAVGASIWISEVDGSRPRRLTTGAEPDWSVRGWIAFTRRSGIYRVRPDGRGIKRLTGAGALSPSWSPDGGRLAFVRERHGISTISAGGGAQRQITSVRGRHGFIAWGVRWSPDGRRLLAESGALYEFGVRSRRMLRESIETEYSGATATRQMHGFDWGPMPAP